MQKASRRGDSITDNENSKRERRQKKESDQRKIDEFFGSLDLSKTLSVFIAVNPYKMIPYPWRLNADQVLLLFLLRCTIQPGHLDWLLEIIDDSVRDRTRNYSMSNMKKIIAWRINYQEKEGQPNDMTGLREINKKLDPEKNQMFLSLLNEHSIQQIIEDSNEGRSRLMQLDTHQILTFIEQLQKGHNWGFYHGALKAVFYNHLAFGAESIKGSDIPKFDDTKIGAPLDFDWGKDSIKKVAESETYMLKTGLVKKEAVLFKMNKHLKFQKVSD